MPSKNQPGSNKPRRTRQFFRIGPTFRRGDHGLDLANAEELLSAGQVILGPQTRYEYGFPPMPVRPTLVPDKKQYERPPKDIEAFNSYWLVSERFKKVLEKIDPDAVVFEIVDVFHISGKPIQPPHHLCAVIREVDALDVSKSKVNSCEIDGVDIYVPNGNSEIACAAQQGHRARVCARL